MLNSVVVVVDSRKTQESTGSILVVQPLSDGAGPQRTSFVFTKVTTSRCGYYDFVINLKSMAKTLHHLRMNSRLTQVSGTIRLHITDVAFILTITITTITTITT